MKWKIEKSIRAAVGFVRHPIMSLRYGPCMYFNGAWYQNVWHMSRSELARIDAIGRTP